MLDPQTAAALQQQVAEACMQTRDLITPVLESAEGVKADMVARGWSEENAEAVATLYAQAVLKNALVGSV